MGLIATTIEAVVDSLTTTTTYVRASKLEEANKKLPQTDIVTNPIALYYDTDQVTTEINSSGVVEVHAVKIAFLKRSTPDNTGIAEDALRDSMKTSATEFYQSLVSNYSNIFEQFQGYELDPANTGEKVFNEVMTGYTLSVDIRVLGACSIVSVVATLVNSEGTTINTLTPAETKTQPDITVTQADDTTALHPSDKDLDVDNFQGGAPTWDSLAAQHGRAYHYPIIGNGTSHRTGDDAFIETNVFAAVRNTNALKIFNSLATFTTLDNNNSFGNTNRFTDSVGGQDYDGTGGSLVNYIVDNYTGLGWAHTFRTSNLSWNDAIDFVLGEDFGGAQAGEKDRLGFTDWFLPNYNQFQSVRNMSDTAGSGFETSPFAMTAGALWTSTTNPASTTFAVRNNSYVFSVTVKTTSTFEVWECRKHF